jgi:hypothetical protein
MKLFLYVAYNYKLYQNSLCASKLLLNFWFIHLFNNIRVKNFHILLDAFKCCDQYMQRIIKECIKSAEIFSKCFKSCNTFFSYFLFIFLPFKVNRFKSLVYVSIPFYPHKYCVDLNDVKTFATHFQLLTKS